MIPLRHFNVIAKLAQVALRMRPEGDRLVSELCAQLRNAARDEGLTFESRKKATDQMATIDGMLQRQRRRYAVDDGGPTPETKAKKRRDCIGALVKAGSLSDVQAEAADALAMGYGLAVGDVLMSQFKYRPPADRSAPIDWTPRQVTCWQRYTEWHRRMDAIGNDPDPVMFVVVEASGVREAERHFGMRSGTLLKPLQDGLSLYSQVAGWRVREVA